MATVKFRIIPGGFSFQRGTENIERYINTPLLWVDDPATGNIDFLPTKAESFSINSGDNWIINDLPVVGTHAVRCSFLEGIDFSGRRVQISLVVATYAAMLLLATGDQYKRFKVINDENKGMLNTTYDYWPGVGIDWVAVIQETN